EELAVVVAAEHEHDFKRLKPLVLGFCEDLRAHFHSEESLLWPRYDQPGRRLEPALDARARLQVRRLKRDIQRTWLASSDYVGQGR
ncbi:MAG: hemerythrin domain-containing protein, partial [Elusimicrobia bacterium]|nr:hemerythrin domain-containing protein [Elusimicrobiota bacterium]